MVGANNYPPGVTGNEEHLTGEKAAAQQREMVKLSEKALEMGLITEEELQKLLYTIPELREMVGEERDRRKKEAVRKQNEMWKQAEETLESMDEDQSEELLNRAEEEGHGETLEIKVTGILFDQIKEERGEE